MGDLKTSEEQADALNFIGVHLVHSHRRQTTGSPVSRASMARTLPPGPRRSEPRSPAQCHRAYPDTPQSCARLAPARPSGRKSVFFSGTGVTLCLEAASGSYSFTVHNQLPDAVKNVTCQVVFRGQNGDVIGTDRVRYEGIIGAGLGQKVNSKVDSGIEALATAGASFVTTNRIEVRVLDFETAP